MNWYLVSWSDSHIYHAYILWLINVKKNIRRKQDETNNRCFRHSVNAPKIFNGHNTKSIVEEDILC
jgi:hypothetical protein